MAQVHPVNEQPMRKIEPLSQEDMNRLYKEQQKLPEKSVVLAPDEVEQWHGIFKATHVGNHFDSTSSRIMGGKFNPSAKKKNPAAGKKKDDDCCGCCGFLCCCCGCCGDDGEQKDGAEDAEIDGEVAGKMPFGKSSFFHKKHGDSYTELTMSSKRLIVQERDVSRSDIGKKQESGYDMEGKATVTTKEETGGGCCSCCSCLASICPCFACCCTPPKSHSSEFKAAGHAKANNTKGKTHKHERETMTVNFIMLSDIVDFTMSRMKDNTTDYSGMESNFDMAGGNTGGCCGCDTVEATEQRREEVVSQRTEYSFKLDIEVITLPGNSRINWKDWRLDDEVSQYHSTVTIGGALEWGEAAELEKLLAAQVAKNHANMTNNVAANGLAAQAHPRHM